MDPQTHSIWVVEDVSCRPSTVPMSETRSVSRNADTRNGLQSRRGVAPRRRSSRSPGLDVSAVTASASLSHCVLVTDLVPLLANDVLGSQRTCSNQDSNLISRAHLDDLRKDGTGAWR